MSKEEIVHPEQVSAVVVRDEFHSAHIIEGGCYQGSRPLRSSRFKSQANSTPHSRGWIGIILLVLAAIVAFVLLKRFEKT
jgi:hypothetical protein